MIALLRLNLMLLVVQAIVYVILSIWSRNKRRQKLIAYWEEEGHTGDRDAFVEHGLKDYDSSLRRKLLLGVFIVPQLVIAVLVYIMNFM